MPRSLVSQAGPLAMRRVLAADATYLKRSLMFEYMVFVWKSILNSRLAKQIGKLPYRRLSKRDNGAKMQDIA
jgi:hypothetical protein